MSKVTELFQQTEGALRSPFLLIFESQLLKRDELRKLEKIPSPTR